MEYRRLGGSGLKVSAVGLGCNNFGMRCDAEQTRAVVHKALDLGITLFDTSDIYGGRGTSEPLLGQALGEQAQGHRARDQVRRADGRLAARARRLAPLRVARRSKRASSGSARTTSICISCTFPTPRRRSRRRSRRSTTLVQAGQGPLHRLLELRRAGSWSSALGRARAAASRASSPRRTTTTCSSARSGTSCCRPARKYQIGLLPYFPLASGLLTGKYRRGEKPSKDTRLGLWGERAGRLLTDESFAKVEAFEAFAKARGKSCSTWRSAGCYRSARSRA